MTDTGAREPRVYTTTDDEREAREIAESLCAQGRTAIVERVQAMALRNDPLTPRTTDRFAVLALAAGVGEARPEEAADDSPTLLKPLDIEGVLWVAAIDRVPIEDRGLWVKTMLERIEQINAMRVSPGKRSVISGLDE